MERVYFQQWVFAPSVAQLVFPVVCFPVSISYWVFTRFHKTRQLMLLDDIFTDVMYNVYIYIYYILYLYYMCMIVYVYHMNHHVSLNCCATHCLICLISQERCGFTRLSCMRHKLRHVYVSQLQASELVSSRG